MFGRERLKLNIKMSNRLQIRTSVHHRIVLRRVLLMTSTTVLLLFIGLFICINSANTNTAIAKTSGSKNRLVNH